MCRSRSRNLVPAALALLFSACAVAQVQEDTCAPAPGFREIAMLGDQRDASMGDPLAHLGDINGDGLADFALAAPQFSVPGRVWAGLIYVVYGSSQPFGGSLGVLGPLPSAAAERGFVVLGSRPSNVLPGRSSGSVAALGDIDGDGIDDFAIGDSHLSQAFGLPPAVGRVFIFYGRRSTGTQPAFSSHIDLESVLNGGFGSAIRVHPMGEPGAGFGARVVGLGDINGDGLADFAVSSPTHRVGGIRTGAVMIFLGGTSRDSPLSPAVTLVGASGARLGSGLGGGFDHDRDGVNDLLACGSSEGDASFPRGSCYFLRGSRLLSLGETFEVSNLRPAFGGDGTLGLVFDGGERGASLGNESRVIGTLDLNHDGRADLVFGSPFTEVPNEPTDSSGRVYVVYGTEGTPYVELDVASMATAPAGPDQRGFVLEGEPWQGGNFGWQVAAAGDVNGDGVDDLLIAAPGARRCDGRPCGAGWVVMGRRAPGAFPPLTRMTEDALAGGLGFAFGPVDSAPGQFQRFGRGLASIPDLTGDGQPEWLVGAPTARVGDGLRGKACLYLSGNGAILAPPPTRISAGSAATWLALAALLVLVATTALRSRSASN